MVQIIQRREDPSVRIGQQLGGILQAGIQGYQSGLESKALEKERQAFKEQFGMDLSRDPAIAKVQIAEALKGKRQKEKFDMLMNLENEYNSSYEKEDQPFTQDLIETSAKPSRKVPSQKKILAATAIEPSAGKVLSDIRKEAIDQERYLTKEQKEQERHEQKIFQENRDFHSKRLDKTMESANKIVENAPKVENDLRNLKRSILSKDLSGITSYLVDKLGWQPAMTENMSLFANATKDLLVEGLSEVPGGRPNQFLERFLSQGLPAIGRPEVANMALYETKKFNEDVKLEAAKIKRKIYDEDVEKQGYPDSLTFESRVNKELSQYVADRQEKIAYDMEKLVENELSDAQLIEKVLNADFIPQTPLTPRVANIVYKMVGENSEKYIQKLQELQLLPNKYAEVQ